MALPADVVVLAAGAYSGRPSPERLDEGRHMAGRFEINVHYPSAPVVLMLGAYEPSIWYVRWTAATKVLGIVASGYYRQVIAGVPPMVPQLVSTYENRGACGYWYGASDGLPRLDSMARELFDRPVREFVATTMGEATIGPPLPGGEAAYASTRDSPQLGSDPAPLPPGPEGINEAMRRRLLRPATSADIESWRLRARDALIAPQGYVGMGAADRHIPMPMSDKVYVVLKEFRLPGSLTGANSVSLILPRGVPYPAGDLGHSSLFDMETGTCRGLTCSVGGN